MTKQREECDGNLRDAQREVRTGKAAIQQKTAERRALVDDASTKMARVRQLEVYTTLNTA